MVLKTVKYLLATNNLEKLEIIFYINKEILKEQRLESYSFDVLNIVETSENDKDVYLYEFEDAIRKSLLQLEERLKGVSRLPSNTNFKLLLHTTRMAYMNLNDKPDLCEFLWLRDDDTTKDSEKEVIEEYKDILPLTAVDGIGLQIYMEKRTDEDTE